MVERSYPEHLSCTLTIIGSYNRSIDIIEASFLKEIMCGFGQFVTDTGNCPECICPDPDMSNLPQPLKGDALFSDWYSSGSQNP